MPYSSLEVANYFVQKAQESGKQLTHLMLQKLVYIAHGWYLANYDTQLISDLPEAWLYGPVFPRLYRVLKDYGNKPVPMLKEQIDLGELEKTLIDAVWNSYGNYSAGELIATTHIKGGPWEQTYKPIVNDVIQNDITKKYYQELKRDQRAY